MAPTTKVSGEDGRRAGGGAGAEADGEAESGEAEGEVWFAGFVARGGGEGRGT